MKKQMLVAALVASTLGVGCKAPKCEQRTKSLEALSKAARDGAPTTVDVRLGSSLFEQADARMDWKERGVRLVVSETQVVGPERLAELVKLAGQTKVQLCVEERYPALTRKFSTDAEAKEIEPLLEKISSFDPADRATVLAAEMGETSWSCKSIGSTASAVANVAPLDRLPILAQGTAESFTECGCPRRDVEKAYAMVTLMADVWQIPQECAPFKLAAEGEALPTDEQKAPALLARLKTGKSFKAPDAAPAQ